MKQALLRGRDHLTLGAIGAISEGAVAIALSKGGAQKNYGHTDPNEDAAAFAIGAAGIFAAVADGHHGAEGAEIALECLLANYAPSWTAAECPLQDEPAWRESVWQALLEISGAILKDAANRSARPPGTTLSIAIARPGDNRLIHAAMGDSPLFELARGGRLFDLSFEALRDSRCSYLGHRAETVESIRENCAVACRPLTETRAIALATDGLSEVGIGLVDPAGAVVEIAAEAADKPPDLRPLEMARGVVQAALGAHRENRAGDNAAAAVIWLESAESS